jgi:uncharacterized protein (DUF885 family)
MKLSAIAVTGAFALSAIPAAAAAAAAAAAPTDQLNSIADRLVALNLSFDPTIAYFTGLPDADDGRWADHAPTSIRGFERTADALHAELDRIDAKSVTAKDDKITYALLKEALEAEKQLRVCRSELWMGVNHMGGWHSGLADVADNQAVETPEQRAQALKRWKATPKFIDTEIANLRLGLSQGYSSPRSVVDRVIKQVDGLANTPAEKSPLSAPAEHSKDEAFKTAFVAVIANDVNPALKRYSAFLKSEYLPKAREALGVSALPRGTECYQASLRNYTTLNRTPRQVYDLGKATVAKNTAVVLDIGEKKFGTRDFATIVARVAEAPDNHFKSEQEMVDFSADVVKRARDKSADMFETMPAQEVKVERFREFMRGSGSSSYYETQVDPAKPAYYRINADNSVKETRGGAEITAVHEAYPGHHMQIAFARTLEQTPLAKLSFNSAYIEGWARYAEMLSEEAGLYDVDYAKISRRTWPARGMVADPGMHVLGWTRQQTIDYMAASGRFTAKEAADTVDRMAILPGQLTAYDSGGLEIMALRDEAKRELGAKFDIKGFHKAVLELGVVPLPALRENVWAWIASEKGKAGRRGEVKTGTGTLFTQGGAH